jgi:antitoxin VapB
LSGIYFGIYQPSAGLRATSATAKLFHALSQPGRAAAEEFRFEGTEVLVSKVGDKVILEPITKAPLDLDKFWAELDGLGARDFLPEGIPDDPPLQPDRRTFFDE